MTVTYPFVPKSSASLSAGDFWAIPLRDGSYSCGRVVEHMPKGMAGAKVGFLGALLDWHSRVVPSSEDIAGAKSAKQGIMHIKAITETGGYVLGNRPLSADGIEPWQFVHNSNVQKGFTVIRPWRPADGQSIPGLPWWGYDFIQALAEHRWLK